MLPLLSFVASTPIELPSDAHTGEHKVFRVMAAIADLVDDRMLFWGSTRTLSLRTGLAVRDIQNAISLLERAGILVRTGRKRARGAIEYRVTVPGYADHGLDHGTVHGTVHGLGHGTDDGTDDGHPRNKQNRTETELDPQQTAPISPIPKFTPDGSKTDEVATLAIENIVSRYPGAIRNPGALGNVIAAAVRPLAAQIVSRFPDGDPTTLAAWVVARNQNDDVKAQQIVRRLGSMTSTGETVQPNQIASFYRDAFRDKETK